MLHNAAGIFGGVLTISCPGVCGGFANLEICRIVFEGVDRTFVRFAYVYS
jgi:hypothetical protein